MHAAENENDLGPDVSGPKYNTTIGGNADVAQIGDNPNLTINNLLPAPQWSAPFTAPPAPAFDIVGRDAQLATLKQQLLTRRNSAIFALKGMPGAGKTALALALAHDPDVLQHFSEGVLWAGVGQQGDIMRRLEMWCDALGITRTPSETVDEKELGRRIKSTIGMRRLLFVIDDVWTLEHAAALRVGGPLCSYLLTSRIHEVALQFALQNVVTLGELDYEQGLHLLTSLAPNAVAAEPLAASDLVSAVGYLPLGIVLIGRHLANESESRQPNRIKEAIERLQDTEARLRLQQAHGSMEEHPSLSANTPFTLAAVISVSVEALDKKTKQALYNLVIFEPKPATFREESALQVIAARKLLDTLVDSALVESVGLGRYSIHQTIYDYLTLEPLNNKVIGRFVWKYFGFLDRYQMDYDQIDAEVDNIMTALTWAYRGDQYKALVNGIVNLFSYLMARGQYATMYEFLYRAEDVAIRQNDKSGLGRVYRRLGIAADDRKDSEEAERYLSLSLALAREIDDKKDIAAVLGNLAVFEIRRDNYTQANEYVEEALPLAERLCDPPVVSNLLSSRGLVVMHNQKYDEAAATFRRAIAVARKGKGTGKSKGHGESLAAGLLNLASLEYYRGDYSTGNKHVEEAVKLAERTGHYGHLATKLNLVGGLAEQENDTEKAKILYERGLNYARKAKDPYVAMELLRSLASIEKEAGNHTTAEQYAKEALDIAQTLGKERDKLAALITMGNVLLAAGNVTDALTSYESALSLARGKEDKENTCVVLVNLAYAAIESDERQTERAEEYLNEAKTLANQPELQGLVAGAFEELGRAAALAGHFDQA